MWRGWGDTARARRAAFARWGEQAVRPLRGEFAFAVADVDCGRVYLAGTLVRPLYWSRRTAGCTSRPRSRRWSAAGR